MKERVQKQVGVSGTLSHWHQREPDKGAVKTHAGNTAPPVEIQPPFGYRAHWVFAYFHTLSDHTADTDGWDDEFLPGYASGASDDGGLF